MLSNKVFLVECHAHQLGRASFYFQQPTNNQLDGQIVQSSLITSAYIQGAAKRYPKIFLQFSKQSLELSNKTLFSHDIHSHNNYYQCVNNLQGC